MTPLKFRQIGLFLTLFTSMSTLICCALPALFVVLGAGAVFAGLITSVPQLIWFSQQKQWLFLIAGSLLIVSWYFQFKHRRRVCDYDVETVCTKTRQWSKLVWYLSLGVYLMGGFFAVILPMLMS